MREGSGDGAPETSDEASDASHLLEHWKSTLEIRNDQYRTFDKAILGVSGGALALSIVNADKLSGGAGGFSLFLFLGWLALGLSIAANIASYWTGARDAECELQKIETCVRTGGVYELGNLYRSTTYGLNFAALVLFCSGILFISLNAYHGIDGGKHDGGTEHRTTETSPTDGAKGATILRTGP